MPLTSIWLFIPATAAGLAPSLSLRPHQRCETASPAREGANLCTLSPLPQIRTAEMLPQLTT
jgi:hypothetical protein